MESGDVKIRAKDFVMQHAGKLRDHYRIGKMLGSGAFGEVRVCVHRESGAQRAVKVLRKSHMDEDEKKMLFNEINNLKDLDHPNILKMYEFFVMRRDITSSLIFAKVVSFLMRLSPEVSFLKPMQQCL